jgi:FlgD Ig-like domain/Kelch motif/Galactose oxidase, central domain
MASAILDAPRNRLIVFGGESPDTAPYFRNDTWALTLTNPPVWQELQTQNAPPAPRSGHTAIYDPVRQRMLVFGGSDLMIPYSDVWELTLAGSPTWTQLAPQGAAPGPRHNHVAIYDSARDRMVVAGGWSGPVNGSLLSDAWALSLAGDTPEWTPIDALYPPVYGLAEAPAVYDPVGDRLVAFGGRGYLGYPSNACVALEFAGTPQWSYVSAVDPPDARLGAVAVYDPAGERMVIFGGSTTPTSYGFWYHDTWELPFAAGAAWRQLTPAGTTPIGRSNACAAFDPAGDRMILFGGENAGLVLGDAHMLGLSQTVSVASDRPSVLRLAAPYPSPTRGVTRVEFELPFASNVAVDVFDVTGRRLARLAQGALPAGRHSRTWAGLDASGRPAGAGIYFVRLDTGDARMTRRFVRLGAQP